MRVELPYGPQRLAVRLAPGAVVARSSPSIPLGRPAAAVAAALASPVAGVPLEELARGRGRACIAIPDATRPAVAKDVLPPLVALLERAGVVQPDVVLATGTHRAATPEEVRALVGESLAARLRVRSHDAWTGEHADLGALASGVPVCIDRGYVEADLRIVVGVVEPHCLAGYSGGAKTVCPGLAAFATVRGVHRAAPARGRAGPGIVAGNPFRAEISAVAERAGVDFAVQCCVSRSGELAFVAAGDLEASFAAALAEAERHARVDVDRPFDVVATTAGGWPLDRTLYQAVKGWIAALGAVRPGGDLLLVAELGDGIGSQEFESQLREIRDEAEFERRIAAGDAPRDAWMLHHVLQVRKRTRLHLASSLPPGRIEALGIIPHEDPGTALARLASGRTLLVLPDGPAAVVHVGERLTTLEGEALQAADCT